MNRKTRLPSLDVLRGFEAAARHLSVTRAAQELFLTQSAVSRQIATLEESIGRALFRRRNRKIELTDAGLALFGTVANLLNQLDAAITRIRGEDRARSLTVSTTVPFASLWLVPRLPGFRRMHPEVDVRISATNQIVDVERERIDLAIRFCEPRSAPPGAVKLSNEEVFPVCSPKLARERGRALREPADLAKHALLHLDENVGRWPWLNWSQWLESFGVAGLQPAGNLRFSHYDQLIRAAIDGDGVALGRDPLIRRYLAKRELVAPFSRSVVSSRAYFMVRASASANSAALDDLMKWLSEESRDAEV
jgi:DNA-binding transcriptional LysR family regulator